MPWDFRVQAFDKSNRQINRSLSYVRIGSYGSTVEKRVLTIGRIPDRRSEKFKTILHGINTVNSADITVCLYPWRSDLIRSVLTRQVFFSSHCGCLNKVGASTQQYSIAKIETKRRTPRPRDDQRKMDQLQPFFDSKTTHANVRLLTLKNLKGPTHTSKNLFGGARDFLLKRMFSMQYGVSYMLGTGNRRDCVI